MSERTAHPSAAQVSALVDFLESNPALAKGFSRTQSAKDKTRSEWQQLAQRLNSGGGTLKSWQQWVKYWRDKKSAVKKKAAARASARRRTGGGVENAVELSEVEERIISLMGGENFATGDVHLGLQPFHETSSQPANSSSAEALNSTLLEVDDTVIEGTLRTLLEVDDTAGPSHVSPHRSPQLHHRSPHLHHRSPQLHHRSPQLHHRHRSAAGQSPYLRSPATGLATPRRRRTRRMVQNSPPSQRRTQFSSITDRFLRVEEQRIGIEKANVEILQKMLEQNAERDRMMAEALKSVGDGLKALADAIKK